MVLVLISMAFVVSVCFCFLAGYICRTRLQVNSVSQLAGGILIWVLGLGFSLFSPITILQYLLLTGFILFLGMSQSKWIHPWVGIMGLSIIPYLIFLPMFYFQGAHRLENLREQFPLESLESRMGKPPTPLNPETTGMALRINLFALENLIESSTNKDTLREEVLRKIHETTVLEFLASEGFGVYRYFGSNLLTVNDRVNEMNGLFPQPGPSFRMNAPGSIPTRSPREAEIETVSQLHLKSVAAFSFPMGYGYVKDRQHVAGFESHRFYEPGGASPSFRISHTELVSLLLHETPMIYQTENLPRMKDISTVPKRPLDAFESESLEKIKNGEDLIVSDVPEGLRMLGSIRNAEQCLKCHGGRRGELLGAFSYSIKKMDYLPKE